MSRYPYLSQPLSLGNVNIKNRFVMPSMGTKFANPDNSASDRHFAYIEARARGGAGLIMMEYSCVDRSGLSAQLQLGCYDDRHIPGMTRLAEIAHRYGAKIGMQLQHGGVQAVTETRLGPSAYKEGIREMTAEDIAYIINAFAAAAVRAKKAGMDLVELHGAHGYLLNQFLSPYYNKRTDAYGGDLEGRLRFPLEVVRAVREAVGPDYPLLFRLSGDEHIEGGCPVEDKVYMAGRLVQEGINAIHVAGGLIETSPYVIAPGSVEPGYNVPAAAQIKKAVDVPVIVAGKLHDPAYAESLLAEGKADMIAVGRAVLADPEYPNKVLSGHEQDIRKCLFCLQRCLSLPMGCVQNPDLGFERVHDCLPSAQPKKVLVIGGGPGGLEAALTAARRGHGVILCDSAPELGGNIRRAVVPPYKTQLNELIRWRVGQLERLGVEIRLNTTVTPELVLGIAPAAVIVATGAQPFVPPIPGKDGPNVVTAQDVLDGDVTPTGRVAIIGGGMVGVETAEYLENSCEHITVLEMRDVIAPDMARNVRTTLMERLAKTDRVELITGCSVKSIDETGIDYTLGGKDCRADVSLVIMAAGYRGEDTLGPQIRELLPNATVYTVGDANRARTAWQAIQEGNEAGRMV